MADMQDDATDQLSGFLRSAAFLAAAYYTALIENKVPAKLARHMARDFADRWLERLFTLGGTAQKS